MDLVLPFVVYLYLWRDADQATHLVRIPVETVEMCRKIERSYTGSLRSRARCYRAVPLRVNEE
jgi:hypothetical protein